MTNNFYNIIYSLQYTQSTAHVYMWYTHCRKHYVQVQLYPGTCMYTFYLVHNSGKSFLTCNVCTATAVPVVTVTAVPGYTTFMYTRYMCTRVLAAALVRSTCTEYRVLTPHPQRNRRPIPQSFPDHHHHHHHHHYAPFLEGLRCNISCNISIF